MFDAVLFGSVAGNVLPRKSCQRMMAQDSGCETNGSRFRLFRCLPFLKPGLKLPLILRARRGAGEDECEQQKTGQQTLVARAAI
jgi:hypothetical protein